MRLYDARDVNVIVDGSYLTGLADGSFVACEKTEDNYTPHVGGQGEVDVARNVNPLGTITVTLKQTSPSNALLNRLSRSGQFFAARMIDRNIPETVAGGSQCWIQKPAKIERGAEIGSQEWTIVVGDYETEIK